MSASAALVRELTAYLTLKNLPPSSIWLQSFLPTVRASIPLPALQKTALFRLLASDITQSLERTRSLLFPADIHDAHIKERKLVGPIVCQVLDVEDIGRSRWSQVEALEAAERGEGTKGREVIRVIPSDEQGAGCDVEASAGPHKLLLQDAQGTRVYGMELQTIEGINVGMSIGTKLILKGVTVARGMVLLEPQSVNVLGGRIEQLHKEWKDTRKERLKVAAGITVERE
ncbi:DUF1767-domain-containing protein [Glonium stellatum]|uniref:RecQ-mediated genome instability protein 1 n=1 Tax=Glonium stellatum TaxID=574774 RepID=A0A8E2JWD5_9PEZI|nr:DUF1767-domain-containing protein [Glonium stellatum]